MDDVAPDLWGEMGGGLITAICLCSFYWFVSRPISGSVCLSLCISILLTYYILISLSIYLSCYLSVCLAIYVYIFHVLLYLSFYLSIYWYIYFVCVSSFFDNNCKHWTAFKIREHHYYVSFIQRIYSPWRFKKSIHIIWHLQFWNVNSGYLIKTLNKT